MIQIGIPYQSICFMRANFGPPKASFFIQTDPYYASWIQKQLNIECKESISFTSVTCGLRAQLFMKSNFSSIIAEINEEELEALFTNLQCSRYNSDGIIRRIKKDRKDKCFVKSKNSNANIQEIDYGIDTTREKSYAVLHRVFKGSTSTQVRHS